MSGCREDESNILIILFIQKFNQHSQPLTSLHGKQCDVFLASRHSFKDICISIVSENFLQILAIFNQIVLELWIWIFTVLHSSSDGSIGVCENAPVIDVWIYRRFSCLYLGIYLIHLRRAVDLIKLWWRIDLRFVQG